MKKAIVLILLVTMFVCTIPLTSSAYSIGDVVGYALTTDIVATINGYDIPSYNVNGYTYIVAEDLRYYGFTVNYDEKTRSLHVSRDYSQTWVSKSYAKPSVAKSDVGKKAHSILYTDIKTYFDGNYRQSYNINGQTIVRFDDVLVPYGNIAYDDSARELSISISGINFNPNIVDRNASTVVGFYGHPEYPENYNVIIHSYDGKKIRFEVNAVRGANASQITGIMVDEYISDGKCYFDFEDTFGNRGNGVLTIIDNDTVHVSFEIKGSYQGGWCVDAAAGTHKKFAEIPEKAKYWFDLE